MLKAHQELLAQVELAEELSRAIYARGAAGIEGSVHRLHQVANDLRDRIKQYLEAEKRAAKAEARSPKAETRGPKADVGSSIPKTRE